MNALTPTYNLPRITNISPGFIAHEVEDNRDAPRFKEGDLVVADTTDTMPVDGGLFLVEWSNGCRSLMETRPRACEHRHEDGRSILFMRKDGPDTVWFFHAAVNGGVRMCDGPYELDHMRSKIVGRLVGVVDGEAATDWAMQQVGEYELAVDRKAQIAAEGFDADLWIDIRDRTGQVSVLTVRGGKTSVLAWFVDHDSDEATRIYKEYRAVFDAEHDGHAYSSAKIEAALWKAGRVITLMDGKWHADPAMPAHVRAVHRGNDATVEGVAA